VRSLSDTGLPAGQALVLQHGFFLLFFRRHQSSALFFPLRTNAVQKDLSPFGCPTSPDPLFGTFWRRSNAVGPQPFPPWPHPPRLLSVSLRCIPVSRSGTLLVPVRGTGLCPSSPACPYAFLFGAQSSRLNPLPPFFCRDQCILRLFPPSLRSGLVAVT